MKNNFIKTLALGGALLLSAQANAYYVNLSGEDITFGLDIDGTGGSAQMITLDAIGYSGNSLIVVEDTNGNGDIDSGEGFTDYGYLSATSYLLGGVNALVAAVGLGYGDAFTDYQVNNDITATFSGWTGEFTTYVPEQNTMYYDFDTDNNPMLTLTSNADFLTAALVDGVGDISLDDNTGSIDFVFEITEVLEGYVFMYVDALNDWVDLAGILDQMQLAGESLLFAQTTTTNEATSVTAAEVAAALDTTVEALGLDEENEYLVMTSNTGNLTIQTVPEPGMLSMMGLACLGLAGFQLRRRKQQDS